MLIKPRLAKSRGNFFSRYRKLLLIIRDRFHIHALHDFDGFVELRVHGLLPPRIYAHSKFSFPAAISKLHLTIPRSRGA